MYADIPTKFKMCKDCIWCNINVDADTEETEFICGHEKSGTQDYITGMVKFKKCEEMRQCEKKCNLYADMKNPVLKIISLVWLNLRNVKK